MNNIIKIIGSWKLTIALFIFLAIEIILLYKYADIMLLFDSNNNDGEYVISDFRFKIPNNMYLYKVDLDPILNDPRAIYLRTNEDFILIGNLGTLDEKTLGLNFDDIRTYFNNENDIESYFMFHFNINNCEGWGFRCFNEDDGNYIEENLIFPDQNLYFSFLGYDLTFKGVVGYLRDLYFTGEDSLEWSRTPF